MIVAVVRTDGGNCQLVLTGNVNGSCEVTYSDVQSAVCALYVGGEDEPANDLPEAESESQAAVEEAQSAPAESAAEPEMTAGESASQTEDASTPQAEALQEGAAPEPSASEGTLNAGEEAPEATGDAETPASQAAVEDAPAGGSAGTLLGIDLSEPWSAAIESLRSLFQSQPAEEMPFEDGYVYVRAPMPAGSGFDDCMIGLHVTDGKVDAVRYALPARFSAEPPAGLEDYIWMGGPTEGWWVLTADPQTGAAEAAGPVGE